MYGDNLQFDNGEDEKHPNIIGNSEKEKNINQSTSLKGKSILKKGKEKQSKFGVKINAPEQSSTKIEEQSKEEIVERRKRKKQFKTVKEPNELKDRNLLNLINFQDQNEKKEEQPQPEGKKFVRKGKRSTTLIEKSKLSQKLLAAEMNIQVNQEQLVIQEKGNPSKKYKPTKMLGSGSFGSVYKAENTIFHNVVAMKVIKKDPNNELDEEEIRNEIDILKKLSHPNIVKIYEFH